MTCLPRFTLARVLPPRHVMAGVALSACLSLGHTPAFAQVGLMMNDPGLDMVQHRTGSTFVPPTRAELEKATKEAAQYKASTSAQPQTEAKQLAMPLALPDHTTNDDGTASYAVEDTSSETKSAKAVMVDINSDTLNYDKDRDVYIATGQVHMVISEQNSELYADKLTYDRNQELAIAEGKVVIIKNGQRTEGSYAKIDLTRRSALINDAATTISAVRVKAKQSLASDHGLILENGKMIISGIMYQQLAAAGGLHNLGQSTGKGSQQAKLKRKYAKKVYENRAQMASQLSFDQRQLYSAFDSRDPSQPPDFSDSPDRVSWLSMKAKEIDILRHDDGYDEVTLKKPSIYAGKYKLLSLPESDFSVDGQAHQLQYLGPDIGSYRGYGGAYLGPGWDFHVGRGSLRFSPFASYGSPGFWSSDGKTGKQIKPGFGLGGVVHFRDPKTTFDLAYNSKVGSPVGFFDRSLFGDSTHFMASYNDSYVNGLLGQTERPTYIAQVTDYRVLKEFSKFQLTSFGSAGFAKDNFFPTYRENYFVEANGNASPEILGRVQAQFQLANTAPLIRFGPHASLGMRAQLLTAAYSSADFLAIGRIGPTLNLNLFDSRMQTNLGFTLSHTVGESPFVFDSYIGGKQNVSMANLFRINKYLSVGHHGSYSLSRDNARNALAVGNMAYILVGPTDIKATIGYDFVNARSYFGLSYYPGQKNSVVNYDKMRISNPVNYNVPGMSTAF